MTNEISTNTSAVLEYPQQSRQRAERALRCLPLQMPFYTTLLQQSIALPDIAKQAGVRSKYLRSPMSEWAVENHLMWLIRVGVLRREVDGQGITDAFRLTPLGRQIIKQWRLQGWEQIPPASLVDRILVWWQRTSDLPM
ncbi:Npun_F0494 family protein [Geitlerinema sp. PCC 9228]|jgi:hypothetical protein|uniref:Npun_F0494 family protein n=1 Tax=Geitlerinema sp. PCC 9228 TaxID=111611 RepID=UPI0008F99B78|nr:Npun_F0494 family protein [Geitlerinema sp. PCC 9228]